MQTNQSPPTPSHRWSSPGLFIYMRAAICTEHVVDDAVTVLWHYRAAARREYGAHAILTNHGTMPATYDNQQRALFNTTPTASHYDHYIEPSPRGRRRPYQAHSSGASQVRQASSPLRLESYGYPSGSPAYDTSSLTPAIYGGHHAEASATYRSSESFVGLQDGWMADVPVTSDIAHTNSTTYLNRSPSDFANVPFPDGSFALAQDPFPTPGTFRLSTPARATGSPEARHYPQARNEVGTSRQREAAQRRRRAPARMFCDYPGCHASFTRGHNYRRS
ncbi:uncharacterized protein SCHCODRAFT_02502435 [Schizophyllum commune H4-8]|uniref:uncharacterized protein n=1 Tax=Schizophyllum commune (strain H4-8 / FGSC 9210) TaxID=578458 RepID=UPI002160D8C6|nr:uncharacterized protein SCHCODRAFT_02502435 [Schizophyllum commune H4-8]KAI5892041.1 hypothetical protein SCHCODRAFT_02502435 [Schizophyllum commune H4-8]